MPVSPGVGVGEGLTTGGVEVATGEVGAAVSGMGVGVMVAVGTG